MRYLKCNITKEIRKLYGKDCELWRDRYKAGIVEPHNRANVARFRYLLSNGCKEKLVQSPLDWKGATSAQAIADGSFRVQGTWFDRTQEYFARRSGKPKTFKSTEVVRLTPLPCWKHLSLDEVRLRTRRIIKDIEERTAAMHDANGTQPLGMTKVLSHSAFGRPKNFQPTPEPPFFAYTKQGRLELMEELRQFTARHREASHRFLSGDLTVRFPGGSFRPRGPFVPPGPGSARA